MEAMKYQICFSADHSYFYLFKQAKHISLNLTVSRSSVFSYMLFRVNIYMGDRDTKTTFHLPFGSKVKFSYRVHLLN